MRNTVTLHLYAGKRDLQEMQQLLAEVRPPKYLRDYPSATDLGELLSQTGIRDNTALWRSADGWLRAYALVDTRYRNIYFDIKPGDEDALAPNVFAWGEARLESGKELTLDTACPSDSAARVALLKRHGFVEQEEKTLRLTRDLTQSFEKPTLPEGFTIRPLNGHETEAAVALHRAAFGTDFFTLEERCAIMQRPDYASTLDLVAVAPDGRLAASCITVIEGGLGFTDPVCTRPEFRRLGLARALLQTAFAILKERGIPRAALTTMSSNRAALQTFTSVGFQTQWSKSWFEKPVVSEDKTL